MSMSKYVDGLSKRKFEANRGRLTSDERDLFDRFYAGGSLNAEEVSRLMEIAEKYGLTTKCLSAEERRERQEFLRDNPDHYE